MKNSSNKGLHDRLRILEDKIKILEHQKEARNINKNEDKKIIWPECGDQMFEDKSISEEIEDAQNYVQTLLHLKELHQS